MVRYTVCHREPVKKREMYLEGLLRPVSADDRIRRSKHSISLSQLLFLWAKEGVRAGAWGPMRDSQACSGRAAFQMGNSA